MTARITSNGALCDRCNTNLATDAYAIQGGYEYVCGVCRELETEETKTKGTP